jgi:hypothetical protein
MAAKVDAKDKDVKIQAEPSEEQIRARAHEIYLAREGRPGDEVSDWLNAEAELREAATIQ